MERRILVPVHDSDSSRSAVFRARALSRAQGAPLRILWVQPVHALPVQVLAFGATEEPPDPIRTLLRTAGIFTEPQDELRGKSGDPCEVIVQEASLPEVNWVVVGHGEKSWWTRGGLPPLHRRLSRRSPKPVLVVEPIEEGRRRSATGRPVLELVYGCGFGTEIPPAAGRAGGDGVERRFRVLDGGRKTSVEQARVTS